VLGPVTAHDGGSEVALGGPRQRAVLALLLVNPGKAWTADALADQIWGDQGRAATGSLYTYVSNLRHALGAHRLARGPFGYRLDLEPDDWVDAVAVEALIAEGRAAADPAQIAAALADALALWTGQPYEGLEEVPALVEEATRLIELRAGAELDRMDAVLRAGGPPPVDAASALRDQRPWDERAWALLVRALYRADRQAEALEALREVGRRLREELGVDPSPALSRLEEQVLLHDPALDPAPAVPRTLPARLSTFVGRSRERRIVRAALGKSRLVSITGPGGAGKTRLAVEVADETASAHPDGVWFADLSAVADPDRVAPEVAAAVRAPLSGADPVAAAGRVLAGKRALLLIDNAEQVLDAVRAVVIELLPVADHTSILVTSRVALGCEGEHLIRLQGLHVGTPGAPGEAEQLFATRCRERGVEVDAADSTVRRLCDSLDGLPLALELAAGQRAVATPAEMVGLLTDRQSVLADADRQREIHRSIDAAITWSYELLSAQERAQFAALGIFEGPFTRAAASAVLEIDDQAVALAALRPCVSASLVTSEAAGDTTVFRLLRTMRTFARERLDEEGRLADVSARHDEHYVQQTRALSGEFFGRGRVPATRAVLIELAEYAAAWDRICTVAPELLLPMAWALGNVWMFEGRLAEGEARLMALLDATRNDRSVARGDALMITCWVLFFRNRTPRARELAEEGLALYRDCGDPVRIAYGLARAGHVAFALGDGETAMAHLTESLELCRRIGYEDGMAWPLVLIAQARRWGGDPSVEVREMMLDARRRFELLGETYGQIHADMLLGAFAEFAVEEKLHFATEMVELSQRPGGENVMRPIALHNLAHAVWEDGDRVRAVGLNHAAVRSSITTGASIVLGMCLLQAAGFSHEAGDLVRAVTLLGAGLGHFEMRLAPFQEESLTPIRRDGRDRLGPERYEELLRIGRAMSMQEAAAHAVAE
jgi:predicted ATPase/DNA-binding SARP family transcriptional activator